MAISQEVRNDIWSLKDQGMTVGRIANLVGASVDTIDIVLSEPKPADFTARTAVEVANSTRNRISAELRRSMDFLARHC